MSIYTNIHMGVMNDNDAQMLMMYKGVEKTRAYSRSGCEECLMDTACGRDRAAAEEETTGEK